MGNAEMLAAAIAPKSDQLNADDLITANKIIRISKVTVNLQSETQRVWVHFDGDNGKPWKPSKTMARALAEILGGDFEQWVGQHVELFRNKDIMFGKDKCGGIQIAAMSALKNPITIMLTTKRGVKSKFTIQPLLMNQPKAPAKGNNILRELSLKLQEASRGGERSLLAVAVPIEHQPALADWYGKCLEHARSVDAKRLAMQAEMEMPAGFNPVQEPIPEPQHYADNPPPVDEGYYNDSPDISQL